MAAKKKGNTSEDNNKRKGKPTQGAAKQPTPKAADDDFGLDDIDDMTPLEDPTDDLDLGTEESTESTVEEVAPVILPTPEPEPVVAAAPKPKKPQAPKEEEEEEKKGGMLWLVVLIIVLVLAAVYYFGFYNKQEEKPLSPPPNVEQKKPEPEPEPVVAPEVIPAELLTISIREGRYYAVIGSFFDVDLAEDLGKEIVASGISAYILQPSGDVVFHRVGLLMDNVSSMKEAEANLTSYREKYGNTVWAFKY
jgi:cell division septation protein DedD